MIEMEETGLEDLSVRTIISEAKSLVDREIRSVPFFMLFGLVIGFLGWMAEVNQSQNISELHDMLLSPNLIGEPIMLLCLAILTYVFIIALFGRSTAEYGIAPIHSFWSTWVSISSVLLGWIIVAYFASLNASDNLNVMALKAGAIVVIYAVVILVILSLVKVFYELRVSHLTMRQMFGIKNLWQGSLLLGSAFLVMFVLSVVKQLIG